MLSEKCTYAERTGPDSCELRELNVSHLVIHRMLRGPTILLGIAESASMRLKQNVRHEPKDKEAAANK
jgi:hypothetical protein